MFCSRLSLPKGYLVFHPDTALVLLGLVQRRVCPLQQPGGPLLRKVLRHADGSLSPTDREKRLRLRRAVERFSIYTAEYSV